MAKRKRSEYATFVKDNIGRFKHLPPAERMAEVALLWHNRKVAPPRGAPRVLGGGVRLRRRY